MNAITDPVTVAPQEDGEQNHDRSLAGQVRARARILRQGLLQVFGIPDYERYLAHRTAHHPGDVILSRREFFAQAIDRKYCRSGPRCC